MPVCSYCDASFWLGGVKDGWRHFCNEECHQKGILLHVAEQLPEDLVSDYVYLKRRGDCSHCGGPGPVDAHASYRVWSAFFVTEVSNRLLISCKKCARRTQLTSAVFSALLGWWGFPTGIIMTPVQIYRNVSALSRYSVHTDTSPQFVKLTKLELAHQLMAGGQFQLVDGEYHVTGY
jgi:hypothetical protein